MEEKTSKKVIKKTVKATPKEKSTGLNKDGFKAGEVVTEKDLFTYLAAQRLKNK